ncbi:MAG: hypothetical protein QM570_04945 [Planctomycetota bacterium]|nr:hypothetical protein [Planctomycetota bacterium]
MAIWNMLARLSMDSTAFDRNSKRARTSLYDLQKQTASTNAALLRMAKQGLALAGLSGGLYGVVRLGRNMADAAMLQERAERSLSAATGENIEQFKNYASEMQKRTVYGDELILQEMAYGTNLGITTGKLKEAATAAMGLAERYQIDLRTAMMLIGRASQGQTQMLTRYGIVLDDTASQEQRFAQLLKIGAESFHLTEAAAASLEGKARSLGNRWGDVKEKLGAPIADFAISQLEKLVHAIEQVQGALTFEPVMTVQTDEHELARMQMLIDRMRGENLFDPSRPFMPRQQTPQEMGPRLTPQQARDMALMGGGGVLSEDTLSSMRMQRQEWNKSLELFSRPPMDLSKTFRELDPASQSDMVARITTAWKEIGETWRSALEQSIAADDVGGTRQLLDQIEKEVRDKDTAPPRFIGPPTPSPIDFDAFWDRFNAKSKDTTTEVMSAWRRMSTDMTTSSKDAWDIRRAILEEERRKYEELFGSDSDLVPKWYAEQKKKIDIGEDKDRGTFFKGMRAGLAELKLELPTIGKLGADLGETLRDGVVGSLSDAIFEAHDLGDALREVGKSMARMALEWTLNQAVTRGMSALFPAPVAHTGGRIGTTDFPTRWVDPSVFSGALRAHNGLAPGERPIIARNDEWILTDQQMRSRGAAGGTAPNVAIQVVNHGQGKSAHVGRPRWNGEAWVIGVVLDDLEHGGPLSQRMGR